MSIVSSYKNLLRRSPLARTVTWIVLLAGAVFLFRAVSHNVKRKPNIQSINPLIGAPGDEMVITGVGFGYSRGTSYVEIAGSRITSSAYKTWTDSRISFVLPANVQDGLVIVGTSAGKSEPAFFANEVGIPVAVRMDPGSSVPAISSVSHESAVVGQVITISGSNFGSARGTSEIYFTANRDDVAGYADNGSGDRSSVFIAANEADFDYVSWSDSEISVKVPDGAASGSFFIETNHGSSGTKKITVTYPSGKKQYENKRTYVIQVAADISNHVATQESSISLYIPKPVTTSFQPYAELNEVYPDPFIVDDPYDMIHKKQLNQISSNKQRFSQTYVVSAYNVKGGINPLKVKDFKDKTSAFYTRYTSSDSCVQLENSAIQLLLDSICGKEKNPFKVARLIYDYFVANYEITDKVRTGDISFLDLIRRKNGDAYDFTVLYTALCRQAGIPAVPIAGILVHDKSEVTIHWWTEIYFEGYGWFPVDVALACGIEFSPFKAIENVQEFYFGNIDCQHIAFSRGFHQIKQSSLNSKIVYRPRTYALQSIWEEAGDATSSYSSLWNNPIILGIY
ncbi:transglutaminase domain-containing protein [Treponema sp.]|uniref:transglutaminase domain-containing protein n=1 Tax=Treponema sp. TaxID=166 RepID=UPI00298EC08F|nr:transglutaminase domain-containing protein [Treponema sp.]MCQ2240661.1 IPT/TIG domain-containing protein [Treponema sp.]